MPSKRWKSYIADKLLLTNYLTIGINKGNLPYVQTFLQYMQRFSSEASIACTSLITMTFTVPFLWFVGNTPHHHFNNNFYFLKKLLFWMLSKSNPIVLWRHTGNLKHRYLKKWVSENLSGISTNGHTTDSYVWVWPTCSEGYLGPSKAEAVAPS